MPTPSPSSPDAEDEQREAARLTAGRTRERHGVVPRAGRRRARPTMSARAPRSSASSARCGPTWCSPTTRGSATGCTPITGVTGELVCDAIVGARDPHFFRELGVAHFRPTALMLFEADVPNHVEDVTAQVDVKLAALVAHESQFESTMHAAGGDQASSAPSTSGSAPGSPSSASRGACARRGVRAHGRSVGRNCPAARPAPGGPAYTWAMAIHASPRRRRSSGRRRRRDAGG